MNAVVLLIHEPLRRPPNVWHSFKNNFLWSSSSLDCTHGMFQIYPQIFTDVHDRELLRLMLPEVSSRWILEVCCCRRQTQDICIHSLQMFSRNLLFPFFCCDTALVTVAKKLLFSSTTLSQRSRCCSADYRCWGGCRAGFPCDDNVFKKC